MALFTTKTAKVARLTDDETHDLRRLESTIQAHVDGYAQVGLALRSIRDRQLYRDRWESFEAYVTERWQFETRHAYRLIAAAEVATNLRPTGHTPETERLARPLAQLEPEEQVLAWEEAIDDAGSVDQVTAAHVEKATARRKPKKKNSRPKPISMKVPGARVVITPNKAFTSLEDALRSALAKCEAKRAA